MKKIISILLVLCMIACLLPVVASAEKAEYGNSVKIRLQGTFDMPIKKGGAAVYAKNDQNGKVTGCTESDNWTIKFVYEGDMPTLTLRGATIGKYDFENQKFITGAGHHGIQGIIQQPHAPITIVVEKDSSIAAGFSAFNCQGGADNRLIGDVTIKSVNNAKLTTFSGDYFPGAAALAVEGYALTLDGANIEMTNISNSKHSVSLSGYDVIIKDSNVVLNTMSACISGTNLTITNSTVKCTSGNDAMESIFRIGENVTIKDSTLDLRKTEEGGGGCIKATSVTIEGGKFYGEGYAFAINADTVDIKSGVVELMALTEEGDGQVFPNGAPDLANYQNPAAVLGYDAEDTVKYDPADAVDYDTRYFKVAASGSADAPAVTEKPEPTEPPVTEPPVTEPPATTEGNTGNNNTGNNDTGNNNTGNNNTGNNNTGNNNTGNNNTGNNNTGNNNTGNTNKPSTGNSGSSDNALMVVVWVVVAVCVLAIATSVTLVVIILKKRDSAGKSEPETPETPEKAD